MRLKSEIFPPVILDINYLIKILFVVFGLFIKFNLLLFVNYTIYDFVAYNFVTILNWFWRKTIGIEIVGENIGGM